MNENQYVQYHKRERDFLSKKCLENSDLTYELVEDLSKLPVKYPKISTEVYENVKKEYCSLFTLATFFQNSVQSEELNTIESDEDSSSTFEESLHEVVYVHLF